MPDILQTPFSRVFIIEDGAAPMNAPEYLGLAAAMASTWKQGTLTPIRVASAERYGDFDIVGMIRGAPDLPAMTIESRMQNGVISDLLRLVRKDCPVDIQVHMGACKNPQDFDGGYETVRVLELARASDYGTSNLGALDADQQAVVNETIPFSGQALFDLKHLRPQEVAQSQVTDVINRVLICDSKTCGDCGLTSDGCQIMFALVGPVSGSPGLPSELLYSQDGGHTWSSTSISTLGLAEEAVDMACVGSNLAVISTSATVGRISYAPIADILTGSETWTLVTSGFVATKTPNRIFSLGTARTWIAANGGYVYFSSDITTGVEVQTDGSVTSQNLGGIHAYDENNVIACGASNVVVNSINGGATWSLLTGPAAGVVMNCGFMQTPQRWLIGTAGGELWYTENSGYSWTRKAFPGSGAGQVRAIDFSTRTVGYIAHDTATPRGRVLRTINGGHSFVVMPTQAGIPVPSISSARSVAACTDNPNVLLAGGTNSNGTDGYLGLYE